MPWFRLDPVVGTQFKISPADKIASAGSCFAQHIALYLKQNNYNYFMTEPCPPGGQFFSAQYGNIYTTAHLSQLIQRISGAFAPQETTSIWQRAEDGLYVDAFRPTISPPRKTPDEVLLDRQAHLANVKKLFQEMEIFVFTLGLTECWRGREDGVVFPVAPGVMNTGLSADSFEFHNLSAEEVKRHFNDFFAELQKLNKAVRVILTVSPVPLAATYENQHVLVANSYSKSALRVAAHELCAQWDNCFYFPSYEIFTGQHTQGRLYAEDLREASPHGVALAMNFFRRHFMQDESAEIQADFGFSSLNESVVCDDDLIA